MLLMGVIGTACSDAPFSPRNISTPVAPSRIEVEAPYEVFSGTTQPTWTQNVAIPDSVWVLVQVEGRIAYSRNPLCFSPAYKGLCDAPPLPLETEGPYGPAEDPASARVSVQRLGGPAPTDNFSSGTGLYSPTGDRKSPIGRLLFRNVSGPGFVWTRRQVLQTYAGNPTSPSGAYIPVFVTSGEQHVSVQVVPTPLRIAGPAEVSPGDEVTFTAEPVGDFRIRDPQGRRGVLWQFLPGDTLEKHNPASPREDVPCDSVQCKYAPITSGRLVASTYVEGQPLSVASQVVRVGSSRLNLTCTPNPLLRGGEIRCTARAEPHGELEVTGWSFTGDGRTIERPSSEAHSTEWNGIMVVPGLISVRGRIDGHDHSDSARIEISDRTNWPAVSYPPPPEPTRSTELPYPPMNQSAGERSHGVLGRYTILTAYAGKFGAGSGPNANWWYFRAPPNFEGPVIHLNPALFPDDAFFRAQTGGRFCDREFMMRTRRHVERHERRHHDISAGYWSSSQAAAALERATMYYTGSDIGQLAEGLLAPAEGPLQEEQAKFDSGDIVRVTCTFNMNFRQER